MQRTAVLTKGTTSVANAMSWSPLQNRSALFLQRKCACGGNPGPTGECEECRKKKRLGLQTKLTVNEPGDTYEKEADRIADQVVTIPAHHGVRSAPPRIQRFSAQPGRQLDATPVTVDHALASPGSPLQPELRRGMEQRFGYDFSRVRVHTGVASDESARQVNAQAYTVGRNIVFAAGRFAPGTYEGRRLIAHELTHVLQQQDGVPFVQRAPAGAGPSTVALTIGEVDIKSSDPNCEYQKGEAERSRTPKGILEYDIEKAEFFGIEPGDAVVIADFKVDDPELRPSTERDLRKYWLPTFDQSSLSSLEIVGFTDCVGWEKRNKSIREQRARSVARLLPGVSTSSAGFDEYLVPNTSERARALNRSVMIRHKQKPPPPPKKRETTIKTEEPATKNCSPEQRRQLSIAFPAAKLMAERAKAAVFSPNKGPVINFLLERYFGADALSHLPEIHAGFSKILSNWKNWEERFDCELQTDCPKNPRGLVAGYVETEGHLISADLAYGTVHVCQSAFGWSNNMQILSAILLHELSHRLDNTDDKKYCWPQEGWCSSLSIEAAIDNADSYAQFAREIFNSSI